MSNFRRRILMSSIISSNEPIVPEVPFHFSDEEVEKVIVNKYDTNGDGYVTQKQIEEITSFPAIFQGNSLIETFDEFNSFINVTELQGYSFKNCSKLSSITFPDSLETIQSESFSGCSSLVINISIPSLKTIGTRAFYNTPITDVNDLGNIEYIASECFGYCKNLNKINIPNTVKSLNNSAFMQCYALEFIDIPENVSSIGTYCFSGCTKLSTIICRSSNPPSLYISSLNQVNEKINIYVPDESVESYKLADGWSNYSDKIRPLSEYVE